MCQYIIYIYTILKNKVKIKTKRSFFLLFLLIRIPYNLVVHVLIKSSDLFGVKKKKEVKETKINYKKKKKRKKNYYVLENIKYQISYRNLISC